MNTMWTNGNCSNNELPVKSFGYDKANEDIVYQDYENWNF